MVSEPAAVLLAEPVACEELRYVWTDERTSVEVEQCLLTAVPVATTLATYTHALAETRTRAQSGLNTY